MTIKALIAKRGLKQSWLADQLGIGSAHLSKMLRGHSRFPVEKVIRLAELLDVPSQLIVLYLTELWTNGVEEEGTTNQQLIGGRVPGTVPGDEGRRAD